MWAGSGRRGSVMVAMARLRAKAKAKKQANDADDMDGDEETEEEQTGDEQGQEQQPSEVAAEPSEGEDQGGLPAAVFLNQGIKASTASPNTAQDSTHGEHFHPPHRHGKPARADHFLENALLGRRQKGRLGREEEKADERKKKVFPNQSVGKQAQAEQLGQQSHADDLFLGKPIRYPTRKRGKDGRGRFNGFNHSEFAHVADDIALLAELHARLRAYYPCRGASCP